MLAKEKKKKWTEWAVFARLVKARRGRAKKAPKLSATVAVEAKVGRGRRAAAASFFFFFFPVSIFCLALSLCVRGDEISWAPSWLSSSCLLIWLSFETDTFSSLFLFSEKVWQRWRFALVPRLLAAEFPTTTIILQFPCHRCH